MNKNCRSVYCKNVNYDKNNTETQTNSIKTRDNADPVIQNSTSVTLWKKVHVDIFPLAQLVHLTIGVSLSAHLVHFALLISYFCLLILHFAQNDCISSYWIFTLRKTWSSLFLDFSHRTHISNFYIADFSLCAKHVHFFHNSFSSCAQFVPFFWMFFL